MGQAERQVFRATVETIRGRFPHLGAELCESNADWSTVASSWTLHLPLYFGVQETIFRNADSRRD